MSGETEVDYDKAADETAKLEPEAYAKCCRLFETYGWGAVSMCVGYTDATILAYMPFWYRKWQRDKISSHAE